MKWLRLVPKNQALCPCGEGRHDPNFIGGTQRANEYGLEAKFAWFDSRCGHYFFLFVNAPFATHGYGGSYELTLTDRWTK